MKSFCIKNNDERILNYLLSRFKEMDSEKIVYSKNEFKHYKNVIIHFIGDDENSCKKFQIQLSEILMECILKFYELNLAKRILDSDYFYFNSTEKMNILQNCVSLLSDVDDGNNHVRKEKIFNTLLEYIDNNKFFVLNGFVNFRLFEYRNMLSEIVDIAVNKYIIDREYCEFIKLLQDYIASQENRSGLIHVIYTNSDPIILDENENVIPYNKKIFQPKYMSDISFSLKDYCLNELLNLLPEKIILHLVVEPDEFIQTVQLIFRDRLIVCKECNICKTFESICRIF